MSSIEACRAQLRALAADLRTALAERLNPDQEAYAALIEDGELHPWTARAEEIWERASTPDPWRHHHLAILHHAKAYDREMAGSPEAFPHWTAALQHWAEVHADDAFWARMARHLSEHMGVEVAPSVVTGVRLRLPRELLEPHRDLIAIYHASDAERARRHMEILKSAPFDADAIDDLRLKFAREVVAAVPIAVKAADFEPVISELRKWLRIDEDNAHLIHAFLYAYRKFDEHVWDADGGVARVAKNITEVDQVVGPTLQRIPAPHGLDKARVDAYVERLENLRPKGLAGVALRLELARHEFWSGWVSLRLAGQPLSWRSPREAARECERNASQAATHLTLAQLLDPRLRLDRYYQSVGKLESDAESLWGLSMLSSERVGGADHVGAAQHLRRAITLNPSDLQSHLGLAQALLMPVAVSSGALTEAEQALSRATALATDDKQRAAVGKVRRILTIRRSF